MTPDDIKQIAASVGGPLALAKLLGVAKDWVYRRISGDTPIQHVDELAISKVMENLDSTTQQKGTPHV